MFHALGLLSVPYRPRSDVRPTEVMQRIAREQQFYQQYFQEPGKAEAEFEADVRMTLLKFFYGNCGDCPREQRWRYLFGKSEKCLDSMTVPETLPAWLTAGDLDVFTEAFQHTGFRGGLNWYRNSDRNWELTPFLRGAKIRQPSFFLAGAEDAGIAIARQGFDELEGVMPNLRKKVLLTGAGHWIQQERPSEVNALLIEFLAGLAA
jgi:pimeloyl-ACP methyl ester carboxylesterase